MKRTTFDTVAGIIFAAVAIVHLLRVAQDWDIIINGTVIPLWVSWAGVAVAGLLAWWGLWLGARKPRSFEM